MDLLFVVWAALGSGAIETNAHSSRLLPEVQLEALDQRVATLALPSAQFVVRVASAAMLAVGATYPVVVTVTAIIFGFIFEANSGFNRGFIGLFAALPLWTWVVAGGLVLAGTIGFIAAWFADAPRREVLREIVRERQQLKRLILEQQSRPPVDVPMTTLLTF